MALTQVDSGLIESGAALENIGAGNITPAYLNTQAQYTGFKNRIINGNFAIWQRGTSVSVTNEQYSADRWCAFYQALTVSQSTDAPTGFYYSAQVNSGATANYATIQQRIEALNCQDLSGATVTISFWLKGISGNSNLFAYTLGYANSRDNFSATTNISSGTLTSSIPSGWTQYTVTATNLPSGATNGLFLQFYTGAALAVNYRITGVQLEKGSTATSFDYRPYGTELQLCQRYFEKSFDTETAPANSASGTSISITSGMTVGWSINNSFGGMHVRFQVAKRAVPTMQSYGNSSGYWYAGAWGSLAAYFGYIGTNSYNITQQQVGGQQLTYGHWTASAEL